LLTNIETVSDVGEQSFWGMAFEAFCAPLEKEDEVSVEQNPKARGLNECLEEGRPIEPQTSKDGTTVAPHC
jgi:hypothetical protein